MTKHRILEWKSWLYGLFAGVIGGGATALSGMTAGAVFGAADFTPRQVASIFIGGAIASASMYLKQSPLPKVVEVDE